MCPNMNSNIGDSSYDMQSNTKYIYTNNGWSINFINSGQNIDIMMSFGICGSTGSVGLMGPTNHSGRLVLLVYGFY